MESSKMKIVYVITERSGKHFWNRVGVAFVNQDGSLNVKLDAVPITGELQIRDYAAREDGAPLSRGRGLTEPAVASM
jgi:hypothetical protein